MSSLLVFNRVYRLEIQSVMLVFSTSLVNCCPSTFSPSLPPSESTEFTDNAWLWGRGGGGGVELCCRPYSAVSDQIQAIHNCSTTPNKNTSKDDI